MAPPIRTPCSAWVEAGLHALAAGGPDAVRVEALAQALGVTKGGFYGHFANRDALLEALLDTWERSVIDDVIERVESAGGDGHERLRHLAVLAGSIGELVKVELAVRDWARRDKDVARRLRRVDNRRMDYLRSLFSDFCSDADDIEGRCLLVFSLFIGTNFIVADHPGRERADVLAAAMRHVAA